MTNTDSAVCNWCGVLVAKAGVGLHAAWHKANNLHGPECLVTKFKNPAGCNCGVGTRLMT